MTAPRVIIVGAGPTGVTAATLLSRHGIETLILDRWPGVYPQPRAVHLDDEIYRTLAHIGIGDRFAEISRPARGLRLLDPEHRTLAEFHRPDHGPHGFPQANMFDQPELEQLLRDNLTEQAHVTFRSDIEVTEVTAGDTGAQVTLTDLETGKVETLSAEVVLGCDGANSTTRTSIGATMRDLCFEQRWLVVDINTEADLDQWDGVHQVCDPTRAATYMRIGATRHRWEFQLLDGEAATDLDTIDRLLPFIKPWTGDAPGDRFEIVRCAEYTFRAQIADRWRDRRVFLLGDAAHLTPPFIGQGMGAGIRDAFNLAWKVAGVLTGDLPEAVLDTYQAERRPHALTLIRLAKLTGIAMTRGGRTGDAIRRHLAPHLQRLPGIGPRLLDSATPPLEASALCHRRRSRHDLAGSLCPNAEITEGRRFDDLAGNRFALVTTITPTPSDRAEIAKRGATLVGVAPEGPLGEWLSGGDALVAIVRPDRTVQQTSRNLASAIAHLPRFHPGEPDAGRR